ncbi:MAG: terpene cyclase/mutase family protein [Phycisphaerae bacterium]|nr:terpene cyclase/mutase family protein [Phycisphaerae bacterium]
MDATTIFGSRRAAIVVLSACIAAGATGRTASAADDAETLPAYHKQVDAAIDRGLTYLLSKQQDNGAFECPMEGNTGVTSLCVMALLAKGYTPETPPAGEAINRAIDYVVSTQADNGMLVAPKGASHGPMYSHCISALMLSEVSGMVRPERQRRIDAALGKAVALILQAQRIKKDRQHQGGWRYQPHSEDSDISCTGWALMTLRSARNNGAPVPVEAIDDAVAYLQRCRNEDTGAFGYMPGRKHRLSCTGTGLLCLELAGRHGTKATIAAGKNILDRLPDQWGGNHFYYGIYYCSQGMFQLGEAYWQPYARYLYAVALKTQRDNGAWPSENGTAGRAGRTYATAMTVLALSVPYRQLPIYQR